MASSASSLLLCCILVILYVADVQSGKAFHSFDYLRFIDITSILFCLYIKDIVTYF